VWSAWLVLLNEEGLRREEHKCHLTKDGNRNGK